MKNVIRSSEAGFTLIGIVVGIALLSLVALGVSRTIFQVSNLGTNIDSMLTLENQIINAEFWLTCDAQMSRTITTQGLPNNDFIVLNWVEYDTTGNAIDHTITYSFEDLYGGVGILKRIHLSSAGEVKNTFIAQFIRYDPGEPANSSLASFQDGMLTVRLMASFGGNDMMRTFSVTPCKITFS